MIVCQERTPAQAPRLSHTRKSRRNWRRGEDLVESVDAMESSSGGNVDRCCTPGNMRHCFGGVVDAVRHCFDSVVDGLMHYECGGESDDKVIEKHVNSDANLMKNL